MKYCKKMSNAAFNAKLPNCINSVTTGDDYIRGFGHYFITRSNVRF